MSADAEVAEGCAQEPQETIHADAKINRHGAHRSKWEGLRVLEFLKFPVIVIPYSPLII